MFFLKRRVVLLIFALLCVLPLCRTAQAVDITTIVGGLGSAEGSDYVISLNRAFFVHNVIGGGPGTGTIRRINMNDNSSSTIGTGYTGIRDIAVSADNAHAYVIDHGGGGSLLYVDLAAADRASATVITTGLGGILGQLALDEAHGLAYVVQNNESGRLWRINLTTGDKTAVLPDIFGTFGKFPFGLLLSSDSRFAYIGLLGLDGKVVRYDLVTNSGEVLATGLTNPVYLAWANPGESAIYVAESAVGRVSLLDLTDTPVSVQGIVTGLPDINTRSVRPLSETELLVTVVGSVVKVNLSEFDSSGPLILGIGHVPFDRIFGGYADTTGDPGYFFQVNDAPFGGTLSLMINHTGAYNNPRRGRWYQVLVDGVPQTQSWSDYRWNAGLGRFVLETMTPQFVSFYRVRNPGDIWYNHWLGYRLDTSGLSNGLHTISVRVYRGAGRPAVRPVWTASLAVQIDNRWPTAVIEEIIHDGEVVPACGIVVGGSDAFTFRITAHDPDGHLLSWSLVALWGDNQSGPVASDTYSAHLPGPLWSGIIGTVVPSPEWHAIEECCAHTFHLSIWDRTIDGYNHLHHSVYNKSITIMLQCQDLCQELCNLCPDLCLQ